MSGREQREAARENSRQLEIESAERQLSQQYDLIAGMGKSALVLKGALSSKISVVIAAIHTRADRLVAKARRELGAAVARVAALEEEVLKIEERQAEELGKLSDTIATQRESLNEMREERDGLNGLLKASRATSTARGETIKMLERKLASGGDLDDEHEQRVLGEMYKEKRFEELVDENRRLAGQLVEAVSAAREAMELVLVYKTELGSTQRSEAATQTLLNEPESEGSEL